MEAECSLPCSQEPAIGPCFEPDKFSLPSTPRSFEWYLPFVFQPRFGMHFSHACYVPTYLIYLDLIILVILGESQYNGGHSNVISCWNVKYSNQQ